MHRFTAYRRNLSQLVDAGTVSHSPLQRNADDQPQYEGVVFSDGTCVIHWMTSARSTSVFATLQDMINIHGHPEYGTEIVWHDHDHVPHEWAFAIRAWAAKWSTDQIRQDPARSLALRHVERDEDQSLERLDVIDQRTGEVLRQFFPLPS